MTYSILSEARVQPSVADLQPSSRSYSVFWTDNINLQGWDSIFDLDIVGAWGGFLFGTKSTDTTGRIGPSSPIPPVDSLVNDKLFFRMKYDKHPKNDQPTSTGRLEWTTLSDPVFNSSKSIDYEIFPDGKWHFYEIDMVQASNWVGLVDNFRFFPCINGKRNDEFFISFFEIGSSSFDFSFENTKAGLPGKSVAGNTAPASITIEKDVNDKLIVNIDDYGDVQITLTSQTAVPFIIARDVSIQLGKVSIGGYLRAQCFWDADLQKFFIVSGVLAADSSVFVKFGSNSAAPILGFSGPFGTDVSISTPGSDGDENFVPFSSYRLTTLELFSLFDNDTNLAAFSLDPQVPVIQAGRSDYGLTNRQLARQVLVEGRNTTLSTTSLDTSGNLEGTSSTFIDINHPFTDDGKIDVIAFNGAADTAGGTKWKIFRPKLDGSLVLVDEGVIGETNITEDPNGGLVLTADPGAFVVNVSSQNVRSRRGDLLGIFNASFNVDAVGVDKPNAMYYEVAGDAQGVVIPGPPAGAGELGLPIYARGAITKNRSVVDIDFKNRLNLDSLVVSGEEEPRDLEYNLGAATSAAFNIDASGTHTICFVFNLSTSERTCFTRANQGFNVAALNDDVILADNGITSFGDGGQGGVGGADVSGATYFYVNGDAEHLGEFEFAGRTPESYDFQRDPLGIDLLFSQTTNKLDKPIGKAVIYFKDRQNMRQWQIETSLGVGSKGGNGSKSGFQIIPSTSIERVRVDNKVIENQGLFVSTSDPDTLSTLLLSNPSFLDVIAANGKRNPQQGVDFVNDVSEIGGVNLEEQLTFLDFQWSRFEWNFSTIRTQGFRWFTDFHWSTKITEFQVFAVSDNVEALGDNIQPQFSSDGVGFTTAELESATTKEATYKLGGSPQFMRLIFRPTLQLDINDINFRFEQDQTCFGEEGRLLSDMSVDEARVGDIPGAATPLEIKNVTGETADLLLDIPSDINTARQLLYFSKLNSEDDIIRPQVGPPGRVDFKSDKILGEAENIANNAITYGLRSLASGTSDVFLVDNVLLNAGFENGTLENTWDLNIISSGTAVDNSGIGYQVPRVLDINAPDVGETNPDEDTADQFQIGDFCFGVSESDEISAGRDDFTGTIEFELSQIIDVSQHALPIDNGGAQIAAGMRYLAYLGGTIVVRMYGAPTLAGVQASPGTIIANYGTNLLRSFTTRKSAGVGDESNTAATLTFDGISANLPKTTRFVKLEFDVLMNPGSICGGGGTPCRRKFLLDSTVLSLQIPAATKAKWYKHWRGGAGDTVRSLQGLVSSRFDIVDSANFVDTAGSTHWHQPWETNNTTGSPSGGQTQGFSRVFEQKRDRAAMSFGRMRGSSSGFLGAKWEDERSIVGVRIGLWHNTGSGATGFLAETFPSVFQLAVLKTKVELGGTEPDLQNAAHFKVIKMYSAYDFIDGPAELIEENNTTPSTRLLTLLFDDDAVVTQGIKIVFTTNCDTFERAAYPDNTTFAAATGCPPDNTSGAGFDWTSDLGLAATFFAPLEDVANDSLPLNNIVEGRETSNVFAAVDLGRPHDIDLNADLFELISETQSQVQWNVSSVDFSDDETDDPNLVQWTGGSSNARWIRFVSQSEQEFENPDWVFTDSSTATQAQSFEVRQLTQSVINQARIYPNIQTTLIPTFGYNSGWDNLGTGLTDNRKDSFFFASEYPVFALDFGKSYIISNVTDVFRKRHDFVAGVPTSPTNDDETFWNGNDERNFAYSNATNSRVETVKFGAYGAGVPDLAVRWAAFKADFPLLVQGRPAEEPKRYNFETPGQTLFGATFRPRSEQPFAENAQWFNNKKTTLRDISTLAAVNGAVFSYQDGVDYGSAAGLTGNSTTTTADNMGHPSFAFDGRFDRVTADYWGVQVRDIVTNLDSLDDLFPHSIWRVFNDPFQGASQTKEVKAIKVIGFNAQFHPTNFRFQFLEETPEGVAKDPNLDSSWSNIDNGAFTGIDTFQEGLGFLHILTDVVSTKGIRVRITSSVFPDDIVETQTNELNTSNVIQADSSGPQTRVQSITIYDEAFEESAIEGEILINHALVASSVTSITDTPGHQPAQLVDGNIDTFWESTGFEDTITLTLPSSKPVNRIEWEKSQALDEQTGGIGQSAPQNFTIKAVVDGLEKTLITETDFFGTTYSGTFSEDTVISDTWIMDVTKVQQQENSAASIQISEFRLLEVTQQSIPLVVVSSSSSKHPGGTASSSVKITYSANTTASARVFADGIDGNNDADFSERDFFSLWLHVNDISLLDTSIGHLSLGNDSDTFYRWDLQGMNLQTGWNELKLQFRAASDISAIPFQSGFQFRPDTGRSAVDFITADFAITTSIDGTFTSRVDQSPGIRYFDIELKGTGGTSELEILLDDMRFVRNRFDDVCKFGKSLYLNLNETFIINQEGLDLSTGTIEFWFQPDWDTGGRLQEDRPIIPTIFRIMRPDGKYMGFFYRPNQGFIGVVYDTSKLWQFITTVTEYRFEPFDTFHVAVVWDHKSRIAPFNSSFAIYIDGQPVYGTDKTWAALRQPGASVIFGGEMGQKFNAAPLNSTALTFLPTPSLPEKNTASCWALIENLKMYNYAKTDFSDRLDRDIKRTQLLTPSEMIEISLDNSTFVGVGSEQLPLVVQDVPDGITVTIYVRTILPRDLTGQEKRDASLLVRWKTPLRTCD